MRCVGASEHLGTRWRGASLLQPTIAQLCMVVGGMSITLNLEEAFQETI